MGKFAAMNRSFCLLALLLLAGPPLAAAAPPVNVIFVLTDNHGHWTLGCYGNRDIRTPNLDRMAAEGMRFAHAFANNPVCSPNRATLLTGLMPSGHGVHCFLRGGPPQTGEGAHCVISEFPTLPKLLKASGYACGLVGKWHLGGNLTPQEGFTEEWVTMPHGGTSTFFDADIIENGAIRKEPQHLTQFWTGRALQFIDRHAGEARPFFLYLAYNGPYGLGQAQLKDCERAPHWDDYAEATFPSFPRLPMHPWQHDNKAYLNNLQCIRRYAAEVTTIDDGVGAILDKLRTLGIAERTVVIVAGDNGWSGGHQGLWGMGDHTRPLTAFDPQMRVPLIWWHPGRIAAAQVIPAHVSHLDFLPTLLDYIGIEWPASPLPGRSYAAALRGEELTGWDDTVLYEFENLRCVRTPEEKLVERFQAEVDEQFDLVNDPGEAHNLLESGSGGAEFSDRIATRFRPYVDPRFDLWNGGTSKAPPLVFP